MDLSTVIALTVVVLGTAILYSAVGQAGASGYLAAMALLSVPPTMMRPTALVLNILVAAVTTLKYYRAGHFSWSLLWPFAITSIPAAFIGGSLTLSSLIYKVVVGMVLLYAAYRLFRSTFTITLATIKPLPIGLALLSGAGIGLLSGLTGVGGGIFLTPLLLFMNWADPRQAASISAAFILINSIAGLLGQLNSLASLPAVIPLLGTVAVIGGWIGSEYSSKRLGSQTLRRLLAGVLVIGGLKLILG
ncbi:MAG: sulfite exporter TauE/SafE family protein [Chloroflexi bacterium]|nr:sulfite exporter TauE/SafE family protein [Chloroflexota bacterium]